MTTHPAVTPAAERTADPGVVSGIAGLLDVPRTAHVRRRGVIEELFFGGVSVEGIVVVIGAIECDVASLLSLAGQAGSIR
jgi:hypothetical protein